ncbi:uncharacterized protein PHA67_007079 isoform 2-T6 [Liasis olivaceus]
MAMKFSFLETPKELRGKFRGKLHPPSSSTKLQNSQLQNENFPVPPERQQYPYGLHHLQDLANGLSGASFGKYGND